MAKRPRQLELDLQSPSAWGGRREGSGRKRGPVSRDPHRKRFPLASRQPCHVTLKVRRDVPSLRSARLVREFEGSLRKGCERGRFRVVHYSIQRDHVHAIVEAASLHDLACGMKSLGARLARAVNRVFCRTGPVVADRFHLHVLETPREVRNAIAYMLLNAQRHAAKLGKRIGSGRVDPASSGRWFDGWLHSPPSRPPTDLPAVANPRTWLMTHGWRSQGLVGVDEIPGGTRH